MIFGFIRYTDIDSDSIASICFGGDVMSNAYASPTEGALYRTYEIDDYIFEIYYGYYAEEERGRVEPLPVFPDLAEKAVFASSGERIVTSVQIPCGRYRPVDPEQPEGWCGDCLAYSGGKAEIGLCLESQNKK